MGTEEPTSGEVSLGEYRVILNYFEQNQVHPLLLCWCVHLYSSSFHNVLKRKSLNLYCEINSGQILVDPFVFPFVLMHYIMLCMVSLFKVTNSLKKYEWVLGMILSLLSNVYVMFSISRYKIVFFTITLFSGAGYQDCLVPRDASTLSWSWLVSKSYWELMLPMSQAEALDLDQTVLQTVEQAAEDWTVNDIKALLGRCNFKGDMVHRKVAFLSGGEKVLPCRFAATCSPVWFMLRADCLKNLWWLMIQARLALCKFMVTPSTLLVLDEPTNHLDIPSKEMLEVSWLCSYCPHGSGNSVFTLSVLQQLFWLHTKHSFC